MLRNNSYTKMWYPAHSQGFLIQHLLKEKVSFHWLKWFMYYRVTHRAKFTKSSACCEKITWLRRLIVIIALISMPSCSGILYLYISFQDGGSVALSILSELLTASGSCLIKMRGNPNGHWCDYVVRLTAELLLCKRTDAEGGNPRLPEIQLIT